MNNQPQPTQFLLYKAENGKISHEVAVASALDEYEKYRIAT